MSTERLAKLRQQQEKLKRKIALEKNRISTAERRLDTRRKIIAGALALTHADQNPGSDFAAQLDKLIAAHVTKPKERKLFGLEPLPESQQDTRENAA